MSTVAFTDIVKRYGALSVLENLNLHIADGEFLVLLGPSGCGKTTLLNMLAGLVEPTSGEISIDGRDVTDLDPRDRGLAMVFQSYALYPTKTVRGNMRFALSARGLPAHEIEERIAWAARILKLEALLDRKPSQLSGGQRQRVAIGRALVRQVGLFLFDEPLSNLDAKLRTEMRIEIKKLHNQLGNTVVYVTHDQVEAMTLATRVAVMNRGVIEQVGTPAEIYDRPQSTFVADFVGSPAMNFVAAEIASNGNGYLAAKAKGRAVTFDLASYPWASAPRPGSAVTLGFRPELLGIALEAPAPRADATAMRLDVQLVERSGAEAAAFFTFSPAETVAARADLAMLAALEGRDAAFVTVPASAVNVFDAASGRRT